MNLSRRESVLAFLTGSVLLMGLSYLLGAPAIERWRAAADQCRRFGNEANIAKRLIAQRGEWENRYEEQRAGIPRHGPNDPVNAVLLKRVEQLATENGLTLNRVQPDKEKNIGDLCELAIDCAWEGSLEALVHFLYAVQKQGAILDVRQLTMSPSQNAAGRLKGNFTIFFAFSREGAASGPGSSVSGSQAPGAALPAGTP